MVPVRHGDDLLGAISLSKPREEALTSTEDSLLQHLASQASLVMRNAQLTAELRATIDQLLASRRRLVEAQDAERRKIERNLHDGAQQQLIALAIQLGLLAESADDPDLIRQAIPDLKAQLSAALDDLRALARGIYPPLLAEQGLVMALRAQAARSPVPVVLEADQVGRYPQDAESTVYFCALEALQNVAKHARASAATVRLSGSGDALEFSVSDDGAGFPAAATRHGSGLQGMSDRLAAHGGTLAVRSQPGQGTTITGRLPVRSGQARAQAEAIALIMFSRAARRAGLIPARMPVTAPRTRNRTSCSGGAANTASEAPPDDRTTAQPRNVPRITPPSVPNTAMITDSHRTMPRACARVCPSARSRPSSRVRSWMDSDSVLATPISAMRMASASMT